MNRVLCTGDRNGANDVATERFEMLGRTIQTIIPKMLQNALRRLKLKQSIENSAQSFQSRIVLHFANSKSTRKTQK